MFNNEHAQIRCKVLVIKLINEIVRSTPGIYTVRGGIKNEVGWQEKSDEGWLWVGAKRCS